MDTILQMMRRAGKRMQKLGTRQKRHMQTCCDNMPTKSLQVVYSNGTKLTYTPVGVEGQFLVCKAIEVSPVAPNEIEHSGVAVSMWEFTDEANRRLFREYHEALTSKCALMWEDGTPVSARDLFGEKITTSEIQMPTPSPEMELRRKQRDQIRRK